MTVRISTNLSDAAIGTVGIKGALNTGVWEIRSGAQPSSADSAATGTLLGLVTLAGNAFTPGSPTNGLTYDGPTNGTISKPNAAEWKFTGLADGVAGWARLRGNAADTGADSTTLPRLDIAIGSAGVELIMSNINVKTGIPGNIQNFSITFPKS